MPDNFDGFLKIDGITSESHDPQHKGWIDIDSFSYNVAVASFTMQRGKLVSDGASADAEITEWLFNFTGGIHKGTPAIFQYVATGKPVPTVEFHARKSGGVPFIYFKAKLTDCLIVSADIKAGETPLPTEEISIAYRHAEITYSEQDTKTGQAAVGGTVTVVYDKAAHASGDAP